MSAVYLHLVLSHVPVLGLLCGFGLHLTGLLLPSRKVKRVSLVIFILTGMATAPLYFSGESAGESATKMLGAVPEMVQSHEDAAMVVFIGTTLLGLSSLVGFFTTTRKRSLPRSASIGLLLMAGVVMLLAVRASHLGLRIRHPEIREDAPVLPGGAPTSLIYDP